MEKLWIGIDPGVSGAYAIIGDDDTCEIANDFISMQNAYHDIFQWKYNPNDTIVLAVLERVFSMPKQGVSSVFKFGTNFGFWQGLLTALKIPFRLIPPRVWQKGLVCKTDGNDPKERSLVVARRLFPDVDLSKKKDHNKADALLMAYYARNLSDRRT